MATSMQLEPGAGSRPGGEGFVHSLNEMPVPPALLEGLPVLSVSKSGSLKSACLTLSEDRFTIYITSGKGMRGGASSPLVGGGPMRKKLLSRMARPMSMGSRDRSRSGKSSGSFGSPIASPVGSDDLHRTPSILSDGTTVTAATTDSAAILGLTGTLIEAMTFEPSVDQVIELGSVDRIQRGQNTLRFERARKSRGGASLDLARSFSIIFRGERTLDLLVAEGTDREPILHALDRLLREYRENKRRVGNDVLLLRHVWVDVDRARKNRINVAELAIILDRINCFMKKKDLNTSYDKFARSIDLDKDDRKIGLTFDQVVTFLHKLKRDTWQVKPVTQIWVDVFDQFMNNGKPRQKVSSQTFLDRFLKKEQGQQEATIEYVGHLFEKLNELEIADTSQQGQIPPDMRHKYITKDTFEAYLASNENSAFDPRREMLDKSCMNRPLSEYWINTSHNTYLAGDQLTSTSTVEMYMNALYRGCRSVELDVWDGERDPTDKVPIPVVKHGHTMTSKIPFADILKSIKVFLNFNPDSFPIILSLENHASIPCQEVIAELLTLILGPRLYKPDEAALNGHLPSPDQLRGMVVLKGRRPLEGAVDDEEVFDSDDDSPQVVSSSTPIAQGNITIAPELARMTLFHGTLFRNWKDSMAQPPHHMHSFGESRIRKMCGAGQSRAWVVYNQTRMSRTYPSGKRVDSSNYSPLLAWATGCQMVALNFQTPDSGLRTNDGRFRENGSCGYVRKPPVLLSSNHDIEPAPIQLSVNILSASCLPKPKGKRKGECIDPYVIVSLLDANAEEGREISSEGRTTTITNNGFSPIWNTDNDKFKFKVENSAVAILQFTVYDSDVTKSDFIATASIPISCLRQGYRCVRLYDSNNTRTGAFDFATLLVRIKMKRKRTKK